jgi:hypothetical protein
MVSGLVRRLCRGERAGTTRRLVWRIAESGIGMMSGLVQRVNRNVRLVACNGTGSELVA